MIFFFHLTLFALLCTYSGLNLQFLFHKKLYYRKLMFASNPQHHASHTRNYDLSNWVFSQLIDYTNMIGAYWCINITIPCFTQCWICVFRNFRSTAITPDNLISSMCLIVELNWLNVVEIPGCCDIELYSSVCRCKYWYWNKQMPSKIISVVNCYMFSHNGLRDVLPNET